ncbi:MAG: hypothetical protein ACI8QC_002859 [Planctomycetota bacterium]|jgi:hypothetical protein
MDLARSVWVPALLGWLAAAWGIECWDRARPWVTLSVCAPDLGEWQRELGGEWLLLPTERELRQVPGVGRTRGRQLARAFWEAGVDARRAGAGAWMEGLAGIGPVTAGAVTGWARGRFPLTEGACSWGPGSACLAWQVWCWWPRWGAGALAGAQEGVAHGALACVPAHRALDQAVHFEPATWPNPPTTP